MNVACVFAPCVVRADACCRRVFSQTVVTIDESQDLFVFALDPFSWIFQFFYWFAALFGFIHCSSTVTLHSWTLYLSFLLTDMENSNQKNQCSPGNVNKMMVNVSHSPVWSQFKAVVESFGVQTCVGLFTVRSSVSLKMNTKHVFMRKYWGALCPQSRPDWESQEHSTHYSSSFHYSHWLCADKTSETRAELDKQTVQRAKHRKKKNLHHFQVQGFKNWYKLQVTGSDSSLATWCINHREAGVWLAQQRGGRREITYWLL